MSRTFLISQPTAVSSAFAAMPNSDLNALSAQLDAEPVKIQINSLLDFEEHLNLTPQARRYTWWCLGNKLNSFIIGSIQSHLRLVEREEREVNKPADRMYADDEQRDRLAEQDAAIEALKSTNAARYEQGYEVPMPAIEVAEILVNLRTVVVNKLRAIAQAANTKDTAQTIADSMAFRLSLLPASNDVEMMRLHLLTKIPLAELKKSDLSNKIDERAKLLTHAPRIIELADELTWKNSTVAEKDAEMLFDQLPAPTQYKLIANMIKILNAAMKAEVKALIKFGRADAITNRIMIEVVMNAYIAYFQKFAHDNVKELEAYEERSFPLPTLEEMLAERV